jgi:hypothetical protein
MKTKKEIINFINSKTNNNLYNSNTGFSNINKSKEVWWFNIPRDKLNKDFHLLLNSENKVIWIELKKGFVINPNTTFKVREDKNAFDLEISSDHNFKYLQDIKSGGTNFNFKEFIHDIFQKQ